MRIDVRLIGIIHNYIAVSRTEKELKRVCKVGKITDELLRENDIEEYTGKLGSIYSKKDYISTEFVLYNHETLTLTKLFVDTSYTEGNLKQAEESSLKYLSNALGKKVDIKLYEFNDTIELIDPCGLKLELEINDIHKAGILIAPYSKVYKTLPFGDVITLSLGYEVNKDSESIYSNYYLYNNKSTSLKDLEDAYIKKSELTISQLKDILNLKFGVTFPYAK